MDQTNGEIVYELCFESVPLLRIYKDGNVDRLRGADFIPTTTTDGEKDPNITVLSKDITIVLETNLTARLFLPKNINNTSKKLPVLIYFHRGGFCLSSPFNSTYHNYVQTLVSKANLVAVSVDYRLAPEHPLPILYEDSWAAIQWVDAHRDGKGPETWLNEHAVFDRVFLCGESAGANIAHNMAMKAGNSNLRILGACLVHPFFWSSEPVSSEALVPITRESVDRLWPFVFPTLAGDDDPHINPIGPAAPSLAGLGCRRVLVAVAEKDALRDRGYIYYEALARSGYPGVVDIVETLGEAHGFHLHNFNCEKAKDLVKKLAAFFNKD